MNAKRGDFVVYERKSSYTTTSYGYQEQMEYLAGTCTSITRAGIVKAIDGIPVANIFGYKRCWIMPAAEIDVQAAVAASKLNPWGTNGGHLGKPFDSLNEVKAVVSPFKVQQVAA